MRGLASLAACLLLAGCVYMPDLRLYNQAGRVLTLHLKESKGYLQPCVAYDLPRNRGA